MEEQLSGLSVEERALIRWNFRQAAQARESIPHFFEYVVREEISQKPVVTAPHQHVFFKFKRAHNRCVIRMPVGFSKCVSGETLVVDGETGIQRPVSQAISEFKSLATWSEEKGVYSAAVTASYDTGTKRCLRLRTRSGKKIDVTPEHPMLTPGGWVRAEDLRVGDTLGAPGAMPFPTAPVPMQLEKVELLALLLAEGSTTTNAGFSTADPKMLEVAKKAATAIGCEVKFRSFYDYCIVGKTKRKGSNAALQLCRKYGLFGKKSTQKVIPDEIFRLPRELLARFIEIFWQCDGFVAVGGPAITLANERMVEQLRHLLLRFGVRTYVKQVKTKVGEKLGVAWRCDVRGDSILTFSNSFKLWGHKLARLRWNVLQGRNPNYGMPRLRAAEQSRVEMFLSGLEQKCVHVGKRLRSWRELLFTCGKFGEYKSASPSGFRRLFKAVPAAREQFGWWFESGLDWDELVAVEDAGVQRVFDFTMRPTECFVANDLLAHNTFSTATEIMYDLGQDPLTRIGIISASSAQAAKPLSMVRFYIEESPQLRLVFPGLVPTDREGEPWTQTAITIKRPYGIRDPSVVALGLDSKRLTGSRLKRIYVDDLLSKENSATKDQRETVKSRFRGEVLSRRDLEDSSITVTNTPRDPDDLTYWLEKILHWPTLTMDAYGDIHISGTDFDCDDVRPAYVLADDAVAEVVRLAAHDSPEYLAPALAAQEPPALVPDNPYDATAVVSLWPERWPIVQLEERRTSENADSPLEWLQTMRCKAYSDETSKVKRAWIERGQQLARDLGFAKTVDRWDRGNTYTGVDLGIGKKKQHAYTCFWTMFIDDEGRRCILDVDFGRWSGTEILGRLSEKHDKYGSIIRIETNQAQMWMKEFAVEFDPGLPIRSHNTGKNKTSAEFGLEQIFTDLENGRYVIPVGDKGVDRWVSELFEYDPDKHTGDLLMASWLAREQARQSGAFAAVRQRRAGHQGGIIAGLMAR